MKLIGLDIGTTTICGVLVDGNTGQLLEARTLPNDAALPSVLPWERLQSPHRIEAHCHTLIDGWIGQFDDVAGIGISNQMHGLVYLNAHGEAVSSLVTWQDERGKRLAPTGETYAAALSACTGHRMATGYGLTTHWYNLQNDLVPGDAFWTATIGDYVAMRLTGAAQPRMHATNAASFGLFNLDAGTFDMAALRAAGIAPALLPPVEEDAVRVGYTPGGQAVSIAIGDNQAGFFGSGGGEDTVSVNVGTSGQVSMLVGVPVAAPDIDLRPYLGPKRLAVGCSLCGGDAYAALRRFFEQTARLLGTEAHVSYEAMNDVAATLYATQDRLGGLRVDTRLCGTRADTGLRAAVTGLTMDTFTPAHLTLGVLCGIGEELLGCFQQIPGHAQASRMVGSGNGLRRNPLLRHIFSDLFGMPMLVPLYEEEAAYGAALLTLHAMGLYAAPQDAQALIQYQSTDGENDDADKLGGA